MSKTYLVHFRGTGLPRFSADKFQFYMTVPVEVKYLKSDNIRDAAMELYTIILDTCKKIVREHFNLSVVYDISIVNMVDLTGEASDFLEHGKHPIVIYRGYK